MDIFISIKILLNTLLYYIIINTQTDNIILHDVLFIRVFRILFSYALEKLQFAITDTV